MDAQIPNAAPSNSSRLFVETQTPVSVSGIASQAFIAGTGQTLLYLHPGDGLREPGDYLERLATRFRVVAPVHPGFGRVPLPDDFHGIDDLAYFYLDLIEAWKIENAVLVGASFGGWLALEIAVRSTRAFSQLVLVDSVGIKVGGREDRDIADIFSLSDDEIAQRSYHDATRAAIDFARYGTEELAAFARCRETLAFYGWQPYLHNPGLKRWLAQIDIATQVLWGAEDGIVAPAYGRALAALIPGAKFDLIEAAGHHPQIEQPEAFANKLIAFVDETNAATASP